MHWAVSTGERDGVIHLLKHAHTQYVSKWCLVVVLPATQIRFPNHIVHIADEFTLCFECHRMAQSSGYLPLFGGPCSGPSSDQEVPSASFLRYIVLNTLHWCDVEPPARLHASQ